MSNKQNDEIEEAKREADDELPPLVYAIQETFKAMGL